MSTWWWAAAFLTGLAGSLHCVGMCGPLAMALPLGRLPQHQRPWGLLTYQLGRLSAYGLLGAVVGLVGQGLWLVNLQGPVSIGSGLLLLIWGFSGRAHGGVASSLTHRLGLSVLMARLLTQPRLGAFLGLGFLNGLLPCGLIYTALTGTLVSASPLAGMTYMLLFGLGTLPALVGIRTLTAYLTVPLRQRLTRALPVATILVGVLLLIRGLSVYPHWIDKAAPDKPIPVCHG
ncbi:sulfite exporter TauE/SafE family protein [Rudanella lutea]|uniref:sulfite exporter TauE/SafE family protein n=1 Tax=Rudanella lutea TaxID=451374 RepID=UPI00035CF298|nr:sulfite exporter TauE/SafE family protein [Rudanella lutea]